MHASIYYPAVRLFGVDLLDSVRIVPQPSVSMPISLSSSPFSYQRTDRPTRIYLH